MANYFEDAMARKEKENQTKREIIRKKRAEAIAEKALAGLEVAAWLAGGITAVVIGTTATGKVLEKLFDGYDEDNPAGIGRTLAGIGIATAGMTATTLAGGYAAEKAGETMVDFMDIEVPSEEELEEYAETVCELREKVNGLKENDYNPDERIFSK